MSTLSQFVGGSGAAIGELTPLPAHLSALQIMQSREYLRTGVAQPYAAKYAPTVAAAPHLALRGTLVSIPNVGTLADTNLVSTNGTLRLYHNGGDGTNAWVSTNGGVSYSQVTTGQGVTGNICGAGAIAASSAGLVIVSAQTVGDGFVYTSTDGTFWTQRFTNGQGAQWRGSSVFIATNGSSWVALNGHNGSANTQLVYRNAASPIGAWTGGTPQSYNSTAIALVGIPSGNIVYVGTPAVVATTTDGVTWTLRTLPTPSSGSWIPRGACYTGARTIVVGNAFTNNVSNRAMAHSTDGGVTWTFTANLPAEMLASHTDVGISSDGAGTVVLWENISGLTEFRHWRSTDHGVTWSEFNPISSQAGGIAYSIYRLKWASGLGYFVGAHSASQSMTLTPAQISAATPDAVGVRIASAQVAGAINYYARIL